MSRWAELGFSPKRLTTDPSLILEASYTNPLVRRWHKKMDRGDLVAGWRERDWNYLIRLAGEEDAMSVARAMASETIGFRPDDYTWGAPEDGALFQPRFMKVHTDVGGRTKEFFGTDDPAVIIPRVLGVEIPEQIALRVAGTAAPILRPEVKGVLLKETNNALTGNEPGIEAHVEVKFADGGYFGFATGTSFNPDVKRTPSWLHRINTTPHLGEGLGLAAYASWDQWMSRLNSNKVTLSASNVGAYVWPRLGFDTYDHNERRMTKDRVLESVEFAAREGHISDELADRITSQAQAATSLPELAHINDDGHGIIANTFIGEIGMFGELHKPVGSNPFFDKVAEKRVGELEHS